MVRLIQEEEINVVEIKIRKNSKSFSIIDLNPQKEYNEEIIITPHHRENYGNVGFIKLKLYCDRNNIKLTSYGLLNQLPVFSMFSDKVILQNDDFALNNLYQNASTAASNKAFMSLLSDAQYSEVYMPFTQYIALLNRPLMLTPETKEKCHFLYEAAKTIEDDECAEYLAAKEICIRQSTYNLYEQLNLPKDLIVCEFKPMEGPRVRPGDHSGPMFNWVSLRSKYLPLPVIGLDKNFQRSLLKEVGSHYMGIQTLASLYSNWFFMCYGGSSNLMSLLPNKALTFYDFWINGNFSAKNIIKKTYELRYGDNIEVPIIPYPVGKVFTSMDENINNINRAIHVMSNQQIPMKEASIRKKEILMV